MAKMIMALLEAVQRAPANERKLPQSGPKVMEQPLMEVSVAEHDKILIEE